MYLVRASPPPSDWGVSVDDAAVHRLATAWARKAFPPPGFDYPGLPPWRGSQWLNFCVLGCSVVACLWPPEGESPWHAQLDGLWLDDAPGLFACFTRRPDLTLSQFAAIDVDQTREFFAGRGTLQLVRDRGERLAHVAETLQKSWDGNATNLAEDAGWDGPETVRRLVETIPGFRDEADTPLGKLEFNKLAHLCVAMINRRSPRPMGRLDTFPVYPDYMLPRFLRYRGVLVYDSDLAEMIDRRRLVSSGSNWELAIRWGTVYAADRLAAELAGVGNRVSVPSLDYAMWFEAVLGPEAAHMGEHHRTVTLAY